MDMQVLDIVFVVKKHRELWDYNYSASFFSSGCTWTAGSNL
jgi:hypothetical protein